MMKHGEWVAVKAQGPRPKSGYVWLFDGDYALLAQNVGEYIPWKFYTHYMEVEIDDPQPPGQDGYKEVI